MSLRSIEPHAFRECELLFHYKGQDRETHLTTAGRLPYAKAAVLENKKTARRPPFVLRCDLLIECVHDVGEDVADRGAKQREDDDHDDGNQHQDESVLYETLAFFITRCV